MRMKTLIAVFVAVSMILVAGVAPAIAAPVGGCPSNFHLHEVNGGGHGDHGEGHDMPHKHVGNDKDLNGDGYICGKHVDKNGSIHVHIDNKVPLK